MTKKDYKRIAEALADVIKRSNGRFTEEDVEHLVGCFRPHLEADNYRFDVSKFADYVWVCLGKLPSMINKK